jgi:MoaA/NifB/PqqE/SkfB family radical SAM enzyme/RNase P/RNase MRP subunit p29
LNLQEMLAGHLQAILDLLTLTWKGKRVRIDGYRLLDEPDLDHPLYPDVNQESAQYADRLDIYEPRIPYIRQLMESILSIVDFEYQGEPVRIDGFLLKRPDQWLKPGGGAADILAQAATRCNLKCRFCYNLGSPPVFKETSRKAEAEYEEILARIAYYVPGSKLGLFPDAGSPCEMLTHPYILEILTALRRKTDEVVRIPTNGSLLTPEMIRALSQYQPLFVDVSLNTSSPSRRRWLMRDLEPEVAINALAELESAHISYSVVIVPWPFPSLEEMVEDLVRTVAFSARFNPAYMQISLPGYSRWFSNETLFDREEVWNRLKTEIRQLRTVTDCPLIIRPGLFEEYLDPEAIDAPRLIGVIRHSPAAGAGMVPGDRLVAINGLRVSNRTQALLLLGTIHNSRLDRVLVTVERPGGQVDLPLGLKNFEYPFDPRTAPYAGCVFPSAGIPLNWMEQIRTMIATEKAREVLILTSTLVRPMLEKRIRESFFPDEVHLHLCVPANHYLGGNIFMGDLLTVEDFIAVVKTFLDEGQVLPDLIIIPSSPFHLSGWGRDLTGRVYKDIERVTGIPVGLIECAPIFD